MLDLDDLLRFIAVDVRAVLDVAPVPLGEARPPSTSGVYLLSVGGQVVYVGEAKGGDGLRGRMRRHRSGDEGHAIQREFAAKFPDRVLRRAHMDKAVSVRWHEIADPDRVAAVERVLLCLLRTKTGWNRK